MIDAIWDFTNAWEYVERVRGGFPPLIISVAITGGVAGKEASQNIPESAEEQAQSTCEAWNAGASIVHIHARKPENLAETSCNAADYWKVNRLVRERCPDIIINNTSGGDLVDLEPTGGRNGMCWASLDANPEIASFDCGPLAYQVTLKRREPPLSGRPDELLLDDTFHMNFGEIAHYAGIATSRGIKPEFEIFHTGQYWLMDYVTSQGIAAKPYWVQFVMGVQNGAYATPIELLHLVDAMPAEALLGVIGIGVYELPMTTIAILLGGHARVGMEDNIYYRRGEKAASNAQFVERVVRIAQELGREIATPAQAREMLGISATPSDYSTSFEEHVQTLEPTDAWSNVSVHM